MRRAWDTAVVILAASAWTATAWVFLGSAGSR